MAALHVPLPGRAMRWARRSPAAMQAACDEAVDILRGPQSLWPVDTGRSKRAWRRTGSGSDSRIYNPAFYASFVEKFNRRPARRTLNRYVGRIIRAAREPVLDTDIARRATAVLGIRRAAAVRARLEADQKLLDRYLDLYRRKGRAPLITAFLRRLDRQIREEASRGT